MKFGRPTELREASFDLTPMIDVVLLLIIFFMLSSQFAQSHRVPMDLPREKGRDSKADGEALVVIDIEGSDRFRLFEQSMTLGEVTSAVSDQVARAADPGQLDLVIRAPRQSSAAALNRLAEALARAGVRTWKLATQGEGGGEGG